MQTFLPYASFHKSALALDNPRLGKQRGETKQLYLSLTDPNYGWKNHPASKMWKGEEYWLCVYGAVISKEWIRRGFKDSVYPFFMKEMRKVSRSAGPWWFGWEEFHASHRSNLLRKDETHYRKLGWKEPVDLPYIWPSKFTEE
jgi:hypothetical protein